MSIHVWTYGSKIKLNRLQLGSPTMFLQILADVAVKKMLHNLVPLQQKLNNNNFILT
jgi:hypothetical protein